MIALAIVDTAIGDVHRGAVDRDAAHRAVQRDRDQQPDQHRRRARTARCRRACARSPAGRAGRRRAPGSSASRPTGSWGEQVRLLERQQQRPHDRQQAEDGDQDRRRGDERPARPRAPTAKPAQDPAWRRDAPAASVPWRRQPSASACRGLGGLVSASCRLRLAEQHRDDRLAQGLGDLRVLRDLRPRLLHVRQVLDEGRRPGSASFSWSTKPVAAAPTRGWAGHRSPASTVLTWSGGGQPGQEVVAAWVCAVAVVEHHPVVRAGDRLVPAASRRTSA